MTNSGLFALEGFFLFYQRCLLCVAEDEMSERDVGYLSEGVLHYLRDIPSPVIPACVYPHLHTAVTQQQQQVLQQSAGRSHLTGKSLKCLLL